MRQNVARDENIVPDDLADAIATCSVRAHHDIALLDSLRYCPQEPARQSCRDPGLFRMCRQIHGNEGMIERSPFGWKLIRQIFGNSEIHSDKPLCETALRVHTPFAKHHTVVVRSPESVSVTHYFFIPYIP